MIKFWPWRMVTDKIYVTNADYVTYGFVEYPSHSVWIVAGTYEE